MSLFNLKNLVSGVLSNIPTTDAYARSVHKVDYPAKKYSNWPVVASLDSMQLVHNVPGRIYECLLYTDATVRMCFSLFRLKEGDLTVVEFSKLHMTLLPFCKAYSECLTVDVLQRLISQSQSNPKWSSAHLAVAANYQQSIAAPQVKQFINCQECEKLQTPVHLAVKWNNAAMLKCLLINGAQLNLVDAEGENGFHYAARLLGNVAPILQLLAEDIGGVNTFSRRGLTPLQVACQQGNLDTATLLVAIGANANIADSMGHPIHYAFKHQHTGLALALLQSPDPQIRDSFCVKYGGTALHYAKTPAFVDMAKKYYDIDSVSKTGHTPLHVMIQRQRLECALAVLCAGADPNARMPGGNTSLHQAVIQNSMDGVHALIVFGADINEANSKGDTPRHLAATQFLGRYVGSSNHIISALHLVGARRCPVGKKGCSAGCQAGGSYDGSPPTKMEVTQPEEYDKLLAVCIGMLASKQKVSMATDETDSNSATCSRKTENILCLDGGGIRGLILIQILEAIEKAAGRPVTDLFDWIAGTSTGGILALALAVGYSIKEARCLYFGLKNAVFKGSRPYPSEPLEQYLKDAFGEDKKMDFITKHKVLVTATLGDRTPPPLHVFRSYQPPACCSSASLVYNRDAFHSPPLFHDQLIWKAARCSGAAPTYFPPMGPFLDGGLIANNPTLDALTELQEYYMDKRIKGEPTREVGIVVSIGTGSNPIKAIKSTEIRRISGLTDIFNAAKAIAGVANLGEIMIDQLCDTRGRTLDRARAWCNMIGAPFYRFSPSLSADIPLDEIRDSVLLKMLWETQAYLHQNRETIVQLGDLLKSQVG